MRKTVGWLGVISCVALCMPILAQERAIEAGAGGRPTVLLEDLLGRVQSRPAKQFLVDVRTSREIYIGGTVPDVVSYPVLLSILRANGLAAVEIEGIVNIVPVAQIRSFPLPIIDPDAEGIPDDEWVSTVVQLRNMNAPQAVPILRPLMPVEAHLAAMPPYSIMIVDRYANVRRIVELLRKLDSVPAAGP